MNTLIQPPRKQQNKTEAAWAHILQAQRAAGLIQWFGFEVVTLVLADGCRYTPDFVVLREDGQLEAHEVKGFWRDDARVKIKVAAESFPWLRVIAIKRGKGAGWETELIQPRTGPVR